MHKSVSRCCRAVSVAALLALSACALDEPPPAAPAAAAPPVAAPERAVVAAGLRNALDVGRISGFQQTFVVPDITPERFNAQLYSMLYQRGLLTVGGVAPRYVVDVEILDVEQPPADFAFAARIRARYTLIENGSEVASFLAEADHRAELTDTALARAPRTRAATIAIRQSVDLFIEWLTTKFATSGA